MRGMRATIWLLLVVVWDACVEPYNVPVTDTEPRIVVDGLLTDQPGPHQVNLFLSSALDDNLNDPARISGATVIITDDGGYAERLAEVSEGVYQTSDDYTGVVGRAYRLTVATTSGEQLESEFIQMKPAGEITALHYEYVPGLLNPQDPSLPHDVVKLYVDGRAASSESNLLRWRWQGTYQTQTRPELRTKRDQDGNLVPDPIPCSGYIVDAAGKLFPLAPCECCDCWPTEYGRNAIVSHSQTVSNAFNHVFLGQLPVDQWRFFTKYHLEVDQLSLTDDTYNFWKLVQAQQQGGTNIFQPNVVKVEGNMKVLAGSKKVFGVFSVSAVARASIDISRSDIPIQLFDPDVIIQDCRYYIGNSSNVKPPYW